MVAPPKKSNFPAFKFKVFKLGLPQQQCACSKFLNVQKMGVHLSITFQ